MAYLTYLLFCFTTISCNISNNSSNVTPASFCFSLLLSLFFRIDFLKSFLIFLIFLNKHSSFQFNSCLSVALYPCFIYLRFTSASSHFFLLFFLLSFFALLPFRFSFCFPRPHFSFRSLHVPLPLFHSDSIIPTPPPSPFTPIPPHHLHPTQPRTKPAGGAQRHRLCPRCSAGDAHQAAAPLRSALRSSSALLPPPDRPRGRGAAAGPPGLQIGGAGVAPASVRGGEGGRAAARCFFQPLSCCCCRRLEGFDF